MILRGDPRRFLLTIPPPLVEKSRGVDTTVLHDEIFEKIIGLSGPEQRDLHNIHFLKSSEKTMATLEESATNAIFLLNEVRVATLKRVIEERIILPTKTTFFYPKLLTGLVIHQIDARRDVLT